MLRGQTDTDPRPNKNLFQIAAPVNTALARTVSERNNIVRNGVKPLWITGLLPQQSSRPSNHSGIHKMSKQTRRHLCAGQRDGRYLMLTHTGSATREIRLINDYSSPYGHSINDYTDRENLPSISYNPPRDIAKRIYQLTTSRIGEGVLMMLGDVSGAFRHIPIHTDSVHKFAFVFDKFLVIDLSCGFGWCGSPAIYSIAGVIINSLYEHGIKPIRQFKWNV
ncbi:Hypothetical protein PHPALM_298 [Phytophthora palmivora]|uniref:Reverse transcriptase domain-containing protein n=1 Tax=Phytophthora palmivora TaxID=4796 RepID=A0A2P4YV65_9STRA|nr:Hypothetical protein PHPALM_298 [Phytophthora palmivora]